MDGSDLFCGEAGIDGHNGLSLLVFFTALSGRGWSFGVVPGLFLVSRGSLSLSIGLGHVMLAVSLKHVC